MNRTTSRLQRRGGGNQLSAQKKNRFGIQGDGTNQQKCRKSPKEEGGDSLAILGVRLIWGKDRICPNVAYLGGREAGKRGVGKGHGVLHGKEEERERRGTLVGAGYI